MKMFKRVSAILITIAMLASMSVCVFADDAAKVQITGVTATYLDNEDAAKDGVYTINVDYTVEGADEDTQVTMLAYVFSGRLTDVSGTTAEEFDAAKQDSNYASFIEGAARAIDQQSYTGTMSFKVLKAAPNGAVSDKAASDTDYLLVKIGTDKAGIGSQAYFVNLADASDENAEEEPTTYTITYTAGDGEGEDVEVTFTVGETYVLPECTFTAPEGYEFAGWSIGGTIFEAGTEYVAVEDTTVVATWSEIEQGGGAEDDEDDPETYTITYVAGEGTGDDVTATFTEGVDYVLPECTFTAPEGKVFAGWDIDGTVYPAGTSYADFTADTTVTATWVEDTQGGGNEPGDGDEEEEEPTGLLGDVDGNGAVNGRDALAVQKYYLNKAANPLAREDLADVDGNNAINGRDALAIQKYYLDPARNPLGGK